jgi:hypothetical protein
VGEGACDHSYGWIKCRISPVGTLEASGPKIGRRYHPQQGNFVVMVTFATFHARCSGGVRRPRSQLRVGEGSYLASGYFDLSRSVHRAQRAPRRGKKPSFSPFTPKSRHVPAACRWEVAEAATSNYMITPASPPSTLAHLCRPIPPKVHSSEKRILLSALLLPKANILLWSAGGWSPRLPPANAGSNRHHPSRL